MFDFDFVVLGEPTVVSKPRESSLDDPALSQNAKAVPSLGTIERRVPWRPKNSCTQSNELTAIGCVSEDDAHPAKPSSLLDHELGPFTILDGCRVNHGHQDQAKGINKKVAFSSLHLLSGKAAFSGLVRHFNALSVEDGRAQGFFSAFLTYLFLRGIVKALPNSQLLPTGKVIIDQAPSGKVMRQVSSRATRPRDIHDRVENLLPLIPWRPTQAAPLWQKLPDNCPFSVAHVALVLLSVLHPKPLQHSICVSTSLFTHFFHRF